MHLEVVTPEGAAVVTEAEEVTAPGIRGEFGILPGHTPFLTALKPGVLTWKTRGAKSVIAVSAGFAEVQGPRTSGDRIVVLTQSAAVPQKIDAAQAQRELDDAEQKLKDWRAPDPEAPAAAPSRSELELKRDWARARLDARAAK